MRKTLRQTFAVDFNKENLGRPHIMHFGQDQFYKNQIYTETTQLEAKLVADAHYKTHHEGAAKDTTGLRIEAWFLCVFVLKGEKMGNSLLSYSLLISRFPPPTRIWTPTSYNFRRAKRTPAGVYSTPARRLYPSSHRYRQRSSAIRCDPKASRSVYAHGGKDSGRLIHVHFLS